MDEPTLIFLNWRTVQSHHSLEKFCRQLARRDYQHVYGIFESQEDFKQWGGDSSSPCEMLEHCESTQNFDSDIEYFKILLENWQSRKYLIGISYAHESKSAELFKKFVALLQQSFPEAVVFFDQNPSSSYQFSGNDARAATLAEMPDGKQRLWFLHPKNKKRSSFYKDGDYSEELTENTVESIADKFVWKIKSTENQEHKFLIAIIQDFQ